MKLLDKPVSVGCGSDGKPLFFAWRETAFKVDKIMDFWKDTGKWWEYEEGKIFYRVVSGEQVFELYRKGDSQKWYLYKVYD